MVKLTAQERLENIHKLPERMRTFGMMAAFDMIQIVAGQYGKPHFPQESEEATTVFCDYMVDKGLLEAVKQESGKVGYVITVAGHAWRALQIEG